MRILTGTSLTLAGIIGASVLLPFAHSERLSVGEPQQDSTRQDVRITGETAGRSSRNPRREAAEACLIALAFPPKAVRAELHNKSESDAIAAIKKLGGKVTVDETQPNRPVTGVDFRWNNRVTDKDLMRLKSLAKLESVLLEATRISDAGVEHLTGVHNLKTLNLEATNLTDVGMKLIGNWKQLESLNIARTRVTDAGLKHLKGLHKLEYLNLGWLDNITDEGLVNLEGLTSIKDLEIFDTNITDAGLEHIRSLTKVERLMLRWCNNLTGACLVHLSGMSNLRDLNLAGAQITDADLVHLQGFTELRKLSFRGTPVTAKAERQLMERLEKRRAAEKKSQAP